MSTLSAILRRQWRKTYGSRADPASAICCTFTISFASTFLTAFVGLHEIC